MPTYLVEWEIELDADNPQDAARKALEIQRDPQSRATVFNVFDEDSSTRVDLEEISLLPP